MQFDAMTYSGSCCDADRTAQGSLNMEQVTDLMSASQWCGCGARPGYNLMPTYTCPGGRGAAAGTPQVSKPVRPMTLPGYGVGPHGLEVGCVDGVPNIDADYPLIWQLPDTDFNLDPMDAHMWTPPTTRHGGHTDPWAPWGYAPGPKV
jgi:hypothetical protein